MSSASQNHPQDPAPLLSLESLQKWVSAWNPDRFSRNVKMQSLAMQKREMAEKARDELKFCYEGLALPSTATFEEAEAVCLKNLQNWDESKFDGNSRRATIAEQKRLRFKDILQRLEMAREAQKSLGEALTSTSARSKSAEIEPQKATPVSEASVEDSKPSTNTSKASSVSKGTELESTSKPKTDSEIASIEAEEQDADGEYSTRRSQFRRRLEERRERYQHHMSPPVEILPSDETKQVEVRETEVGGSSSALSEHAIEAEIERQPEIPSTLKAEVDEAKQPQDEVSTEPDIVLNSDDHQSSSDSTIAAESQREIAAIDVSQNLDSNDSVIAETSQDLSNVHSKNEIDSRLEEPDDNPAEQLQKAEETESEGLIFESASPAISENQDKSEDGPVFSSENETLEASLFERAILNLQSQKGQIDQPDEVGISKESALEKETKDFDFLEKQEAIPSGIENFFEDKKSDLSEETDSVFSDYKSPDIPEESYSQDNSQKPSIDPALFGGFEMEYAPPAGHADEKGKEEFLEEESNEIIENEVRYDEVDDLQEPEDFAWPEEPQQITEGEDQNFENEALTDSQSETENEPYLPYTENQENEWEASSLEAGTEFAQNEGEEHHYEDSFEGHQQQLDSDESEIAWENTAAVPQEENIEGDEITADYAKSDDQWTEDDYLASDDEDQNWAEDNPDSSEEVFYDDELDPNAQQDQEAEYDELQDEDVTGYAGEEQYDSYQEEEYDEPFVDDLKETSEFDNANEPEHESLETTFARGNQDNPLAALASEEDLESESDFDDDDFDDKDLEGILDRPRRYQSRIVTVVGVLMIFVILGGAVAGYFYFSNKNPDIEALMAAEGAANGANSNSEISEGANSSFVRQDTSSTQSDPTELLTESSASGTANKTISPIEEESPKLSAAEAFSLGQDLEMSGVPGDMAKALDAYLIAGELGMASAQLRLGIFYFEGLAGQPNYTKASEWYLKAAERGRPEAQFYLACMALQNIGPRNELNNPAHWLREASDQQYSNAQVNLALLYLDGAGSITRDPNIAAMLLRQAAEQGNPLGQALLGMLYDRGESVEEDPLQAERWYRKAVEREPLENPMDVPGLPPVTRQTSWEILHHAQKVLATKILETTGTNNSSQIEEAKKLLESAAETNDPQAQFHLGLLYCDSSLSETDYSQAKKWFQEAASSNYPPAWVNLGWMYENGYGVEKDITKAEENYINAVNSGDALAQYRLGLLYLYEGDKSSGDEIKAYHWIKTAASNGVAEAVTKLNEWEKELSAKGTDLSTSAVEAWRILDSLTELETQSDPNSQSMELENNNSSLTGFSIVSVFKLL